MRTVLFIALASLAAGVMAADPIGRVLSVRGAVTAGPGIVAPGYLLEPGMRLGSGKGAEVALKMADGSLVFVQQSTNLLLESFTPGGAVYALDGGTVRLVPNAAGGGDGGSVSVKTPYGEVLSSATDFTAGICASGCPDAPGVYVCVGSGQASVSSFGKTSLVTAGQCAQLTEQKLAVISEAPSFMVSAAGVTFVLDADVGGPGIGRLGQDAQDFLSGIIDTPASPSVPSATASR